MKTLIRNATIVAMDEAHGSDPFIGSILIEEGSIAAVGPDVGADAADRVIEGADRLVMPGLVNAHFHSFDVPYKGYCENLPLELWMLYCYPAFGFRTLSREFIYLRSLVIGIECLKAGVTTVLDDILEVPTQDMRALDAVFRAYDDLGIRANVSGHVINKPFADTLPLTERFLGDDLKAKMGTLPVPTTEGYLEFVRQAIARHHDKNERLRFVIAPSGPQRCTDDLLTGALELAHEHDTAYHTHVLETKMQAVTGEEHYGKSLIRHMHDIGILGERTTIAHAVWVSDEDIELMADAGCSVAHNPISNLKLGSGIAPYRKLLDAGINLALGSDAPSAGDTPRMFDVMKFAGLIHKVATPDYTRWPRAAEIVRAATINGARSAALGAKVGSLEAGKKADLLILNLRSLNFTPLNNIDMHLVYCENGGSIETVMVEGEIVVEDGRVLTCDEAEIMQEFRKQMVEFMAMQAEIEPLNRELVPAFAEIHRHCSARDVGMNRYASDFETW